VNSMLDAFYLAVGCIFLLTCWGLAKVCDKL
jgi:hypothetical protein